MSSAGSAVLQAGRVLDDAPQESPKTGEGGEPRPDRAIRALSFVLAAIAIIIAAPMLVLLAVLVRLSGPGPILYRGPRVGYKGKTITILKFRTMRVGTEATIGARLVGPDDDVVTSVGRLLRYCKFDELPQLFNVLRGDMNLVGPRPMRPIFLSKLRGEIPGYMRRFDVPPGITGLAPVRGGY